VTAVPPESSPGFWRPQVGHEAAEVPEAAQELGLGEAQRQAGLDSRGAITQDSETPFWCQAPTQEEVAQGTVGLLVLLGGEDGAQDFLRASGIPVGGDDEGVGVIPPAMGQRPPKMTVEAIGLDFVGGARYGA
jgi:hypothetical protein